MMLDQFLASLNPDLRTFIKEHRPSSLDQAVQLANDWASAYYTFRSSSRSFKPPLNKNTACSLVTFTDFFHYQVSWIPRCPKNPSVFKESPPSQPLTVRFCLSDHRVPQTLVSGTVNGPWTSSNLRDTGCSCIVVAEEVLPDAYISNCRSYQVADYLGRVDTFPIVQCYIRCPYFDGWTDASFSKPCSVSKDSLPPVTSSVSQDSLPPVTSSACAVEIRASTTRMKRLHPLHLPDLQPLSVKS
ncbi:hypothetical protein E2C01_079753 [Portunus trituberculatus]|uniref:SCAN box domain-containing protein n=1 Tax=Portunus trituberculatus TaxID=210409 RepID=A0A5B7IRB7_PORTR|nr:hypothetical protein [Portunus trituberculatus]